MSNRRCQREALVFILSPLTAAAYTMPVVAYPIAQIEDEAAASQQPGTLFDPNPIYIKAIGTDQVGQGAFVRGANGCVVVTLAHIVTDASVVFLTGNGGRTVQGTVRFLNPQSDIAIIEPDTTMGDCGLLSDDTSVDGAIAAPALSMLTREPNGSISRTELRPVLMGEQELQLASSDPRHVIPRGLSGSPIIAQGRIVGILTSGTGEKKRGATLMATRSDFIAHANYRRIVMSVAARTDDLQRRDMALNTTTAQRAAAFHLDLEGVRTDDPPPAVEDGRPVRAAAELGRVLPSKGAITEPTRLSSGFVWPAYGRIVQRFGPGSSGERFNGVKIAVPVGTPVLAAADGVVAYAGSGVPTLGGLIIVKHGDGWTTVYGHSSQLLVQRGQSVKRGQTIALSGDSGVADQPEVHFEMRSGRTPVDPIRELPRRDAVTQ